MKLKVQPIRIKTGKYKVVLNLEDAKEIGVRGGDRVQLKNHSYLTAVVETGDMIEVGTVGVYQECCERLGKECPLTLEIIPTSKPSSVSYIKKIMDKEKLTQEEIFQIVQDIVRDTLTDIEMTAFITSTYIHGLSTDEIEWLTRAMIDTGEKIEFETHPIMDKHSIGGVPGNKITLLVVPIVAANGLLDEIKSITEKVGGIIAWGGATNIAPADDKLIHAEYPLSIDPHCQLLASIMAKKGAVGADSVVIDIPVGQGTKIPTIQEGKKLARELIELGERLGMNVECAMTYGASPVGRTIGPIIEVREALKVLETMEGPNSLIEKSTALAGILLEMGGVATKGRGKELAMETLRSGKALSKLREIIEAQGGNPNVTYKDLIPGEHKGEIASPADGYVIEFDNKRIVEIARLAGAPIDKGAGVWINRKKGELVRKGEPLITIYSEKEWKLDNALKSAQKDNPIIVEGMLLERIKGLGVI
ncbi:MAG: thymidine phosphorylase [Candidatus Methanoperedens sp.]|nr:thymidine phosphorylase [Candidatus Methanoperedens sp.]PKL53283.1 MAG: thymidine phosphorylase [Candidatus Methanoperedenaceae archaeon HGW-Methanoperedenaceae-1]